MSAQPASGGRSPAWWAAALLALLFALLPGRPAEAARRLALVVANADYGGGLPDLPNARNDGRAVADALEDLGYEVIRAFDADRATFDRRYGEFRDRARDAALSLFYYAGHAVQVDGVNFLIPVGAEIRNQQDLAREAVAAQPLLQWPGPREGPAVFVFDSCRNNPFSGVLRATPTRGLGSRDGLAEMDPGLDTLLVYSTSPGDEALDGEGEHSPFAEGFLRYLPEPGLEVRQFVTRVRRYVVDATQGDQIPWDHSSLLADVYLAPQQVVARAEPSDRPAGGTALSAFLGRDDAGAREPVTGTGGAVLGFTGPTGSRPRPSPDAERTSGGASGGERRAVEGEDTDIWAVIGLGRAARNRGAIREARDRFAQALGMAEVLSRAAEKSTALRELAASWQGLGDLARAERHYLQARDVLRELVDEEPSEPRWRRDLAKVWTGLGDVWRAQGHLERAATAYAEALRLRERLVAADADSRRWRRELFVSLTRMGDLARARANDPGALEHYEKALALARTLQKAEPESTERVRDLAVALVNLADLLHFLDRSQQADGPAAEAVRLVRRLASAFPDRMDYKRDLAVAADIRGDVLLALGEFGAAENSYREALRIRDELTRLDPDNATWRRDLSVSWIKLGDVLRRRGQAEAAARAYENALSLRRRLSEMDPTNADWYRDRMVPHFKLALLAESRRDYAQAQRHWRRALGVLRDLDRSRRLRPADRKLLKLFEQRRARAAKRARERIY